MQLTGKATISPAVINYLTEVKAKHAASAEARKLFQLLLEPILEAQTKQQLIVIRDGQLHLVPFDGLINSQGRYVVESRSVDYAPSATSFFLLRTAYRKHPSQGLLAIGGVPYGHSNLRETALYPWLQRNRPFQTSRAPEMRRGLPWRPYQTE